jgi:hypothetical protein
LISEHILPLLLVHSSLTEVRAGCRILQVNVQLFTLIDRSITVSGNTTCIPVHLSYDCLFERLYAAIVGRHNKFCKATTSTCDATVTTTTSPMVAII